MTTYKMARSYFYSNSRNECLYGVAPNLSTLFFSASIRLSWEALRPDSLENINLYFSVYMLHGLFLFLFPTVCSSRLQVLGTQLGVTKMPTVGTLAQVLIYIFTVVSSTTNLRPIVPG